MRKILTVLMIALWASFVSAEEIPPGSWMQTASTAGDTDCSLHINSVTDRIIAIDASNGWKGFAYYDETKDMYSGFFELLPNSLNPDAKWRNRLFQMKLKYDGRTVTLDGQSGDLIFAATYWKE